MNQLPVILDTLVLKAPSIKLNVEEGIWLPKLMKSEYVWNVLLVFKVFTL